STVSRPSSAPRTGCLRSGPSCWPGAVTGRRRARHTRRRSGCAPTTWSAPAYAGGRTCSPPAPLGEEPGGGRVRSDLGLAVPGGLGRRLGAEAVLRLGRLVEPGRGHVVDARVRVALD